MEHAFSGSNRSLSSHLYVYWVVNFSSNRWALHIDDANCSNSFNFFTVCYNIAKVFCLTWLTYQHNCLVFTDILGIELNGVKNANFFKSF